MTTQRCSTGRLFTAATHALNTSCLVKRVLRQRVSHQVADEQTGDNH